MDSIQNPEQSFQGDSSLKTTESLGVPGTLLIILTMETPSGYKLNMTNKTYLHPIRPSDYSKSVSSCHVLTSRPHSNKISPYLKLKLLVLSPGIFYPPSYSLKNLERLPPLQNYFLS